MLVLISGVTGTGKTVFVDELVARYAWRQVPTVTTRPSRSGETHKRSISPDHFAAMEASGQLFCRDEFYGHLYASPHRAIFDATRSDQEKWIKDRPVSALGAFAGIDYRHIIVLPNSEEQLIAQLLQAGRAERLPAALVDYHKNYCPFYAQVHPHGTTERRIVIINYVGQSALGAAILNDWTEATKSTITES
jgi:hypothetical protein